MRLFPINAKNTLGLFGALMLSACASSPSTNPRPVQSSVDTAYAALVSEVANCAKEVKVCVEGAGSDSAARAACRVQFDTCRASAGERATHALADAVTACTSQHNACVRQGHGAAPDCKDELKSCLRAAHPQRAEDEDGGVDEQGRKSDCLDELHSCVEADGPANVCAAQVRSCVVDAVPTGDELVPEDDSDDSADESDESAGDSDDAADEGADDDADNSGASADAGTPEQPQPANDGHSGADKAPNGAAKNAARKAAASQCLDAFTACVDAGAAQRDCARSLKECRRAAAP